MNEIHSPPANLLSLSLSQLHEPYIDQIREILLSQLFDLQKVLKAIKGQHVYFVSIQSMWYFTL